MATELERLLLEMDLVDIEQQMLNAGAEIGVGGLSARALNQSKWRTSEFIILFCPLRSLNQEMPFCYFQMSQTDLRKLISRKYIFFAEKRINLEQVLSGPITVLDVTSLCVEAMCGHNYI